jgi:hypothetical protein
MKKKIYLLALLMVAVSTIVIDGCKKKDDDEPEDARNKYVATYGAVENGTDFGGNVYDNYKYDFTVTKSSTVSTDILISNFGNFNVTVKATVSGSNITIPQQTQNITQGPAGFSGSGSINGNVLTFDYHVSVGSAASDAHVVATKK